MKYKILISMFQSCYIYTNTHIQYHGSKKKNVIRFFREMKEKALSLKTRWSDTFLWYIDLILEEIAPPPPPPPPPMQLEPLAIRKSGPNDTWKTLIVSLNLIQTLSGHDLSCVRFYDINPPCVQSSNSSLRQSSPNHQT